MLKSFWLGKEVRKKYSSLCQKKNDVSGDHSMVTATVTWARIGGGRDVLQRGMRTYGGVKSVFYLDCGTTYNM